MKYENEPSPQNDQELKDRLLKNLERWEAEDKKYGYSLEHDPADFVEKCLTNFTASVSSMPGSTISFDEKNIRQTWPRHDVHFVW